MPNFLFEILVEEIPHGVLPSLTEHTKSTVSKLLEDSGLTFDSIEYFISPRRIAFLIREMAEKGSDQIIEQKGPSLKAAYTPEGQMTRALEGFLSSYNAKLEDLEEREIKGQKYLFLQKTELGQDTQVILPNLLKDFVTSFKFTQPMRWNFQDQVFEFIRPVRALTAVLDDKILPFEFWGLQAGNILQGHRQLSNKHIILDNALNYVSLLEESACIPSFNKRQQMIQDQATKLAQSINGHLLLDEELLSILASLTEYPHPILAQFDEQYLQLPKEVLISEMKIHQKYVPILDTQQNLLPYYIITANMSTEDEDRTRNILAGNNRVLTARFADGKFFFEEDLKKGLKHYTETLKSVSFVEGAGSIADKVVRMQSVAEYLRTQLAPQISAEDLAQAVALCKSDLSSLMVGEFPELQGIIGSYYAQAEKLSPAVATAIREHYYPMMSDEGQVLPTQELSALVGLADRLDNLLTLYAVGKTVTGSRDPYALRRQTIAVITLLTQYQWKTFSLDAFFEHCSSLYTPFLSVDIKEWQQLINDFIKTRLEGVLKSEPYHFSSDTLNAVLGHIDILWENVEKSAILHDVRHHDAQNFSALVELFKRIMNICKGAEPQVLNESFLVESAEKSLFVAYQHLNQKFSQLGLKEQLIELLALKNAITEFFDQIMVKTGDEKEKNRIALLQKIAELFFQFADFSKLS